jgi:hypothetical protein
MPIDDGDTCWLDVESDDEADALMGEADLQHGEFDIKAEEAKMGINIEERFRKGQSGVRNPSNILLYIKY